MIDEKWHIALVISSSGEQTGVVYDGHSKTT